MKIGLLAPAQRELLETVERYNQESDGLGFEFAAEFRRTVARIEQFPEAWPLLSRRTRRCRMKRFPYGVIYQARGDILLIVGVMHLHRDPEAWKSRLGPDAT